MGLSSQTPDLMGLSSQQCMAATKMCFKHKDPSQGLKYHPISSIYADISAISARVKTLFFSNCHRSYMYRPVAADN